MKIKPKLRFPEFDGEWEEKQLSAILEIGTGKSKVQSNESGKYNILGSTGIIGKSHTYDYEGDFILTARVGHYAGKLYKHSGKVNISDNTIYLFNFINKNFIYESLNAFKLEKLVFGSGQPLIKASDLKKLKIRVPVSKEQKKIGGFFSKLDRQIELEEQKLEKLEEQKKGYMQQIFSQKLRFKDDNGNYYPEWKEKNLGDISELITKGTTPKNKVNDGSINFIKVENISPINGFITNTTKITEEEHSTYLKRSQLKENDILFSIAGTLGRVSVVKREILPANTNQALAIIRLNAMNLEYIKTYLTGRAIKRFIANNPTVGAQPNMSLTQIRDLIIAIPNLTEQEKIGSFFKKIDNSIKKQSDKIWLLKKRKKGFLQKMFI